MSAEAVDLLTRFRDVFRTNLDKVTCNAHRVLRDFPPSVEKMPRYHVKLRFVYSFHNSEFTVFHAVYSSGAEMVFKARSIKMKNYSTVRFKWFSL